MQFSVDPILHSIVNCQKVKHGLDSGQSHEMVLGSPGLGLDHGPKKILKLGMLNVLYNIRITKNQSAMKRK